MALINGQTFRRYAIPLGTAVTGAVLRNRAVSGAQQRLTGGVNRASDIIQRGNTDVMGTLRGAYDEQKQTLNPFITAGRTALETMKPVEPFKFNAAELQNDPGQQFITDEGLKAIRRQGNADMNRFSGATFKRFVDYGQDRANTFLNDTYRRQEGTFRANQLADENRLNALLGTGLNASGQQVDAAGNYGNAAARTQQFTAQQIADLETERANAEAEGDIQRANSIADLLSSVGETVSGNQILDRVLGKGGTAARNIPNLPIPYGGSAAAASSAIPGVASAAPQVGPAVLTGASLAGGGGAAAAIPGVATAAPEVAPATLAPGAAGGGFQSAVTGLLTNPITIGVAGAILGTMALLKSQAHWEANTWVQGFQNKFDRAMSQATEQFKQLAGSGQLSRDQALGLRQSIANSLSEYEAKRQQFAKQGSDEKKVADQALQTFNYWYGPNGSKTLGEIDSIIARLA